MASKSSPTGFLAKMAQMVRVAPAAEEQHSDFAHSDLQARIDGKRRDDQVRRREFNHLRKVRANAQAGVTGWQPVSVFPASSSFNPDDMTADDRASTLQKIDAIEADMNAHFRKRKATASGPAPLSRQAPLQREIPVLRQTVSAPDSEGGDDLDLDFTYLRASSPPPDEIPVSVPAPAASTVPAAVVPAAALSPTSPKSPTEAGPSSSFSDSRLETLELGGGTDNPALQDAAFRYAEGDFASAEAALLAVVQDATADAAMADACACAVLDLYRATDQGASFDVVAIEYAQRFGRSSPEWYSIPLLLKQSKHAPAAAAPSGQSVWTCPPLLDAASVAQMAATQNGSTRHLHWGGLQSIAPDAVSALTRHFTQWAEQPLALVFGGAEVFNAALEAATVVGERQTDPAWWMLRMEALRVQGQHEAFETVALDYCVTYDVSPPSWLEADCMFSLAAEDDAALPVQEADSVIGGLMDARGVEVLELRGELLGDAVQALNKLQRKGPVGEALVIHCLRLQRVDFSAAGSMLNWLTERCAEGVQVELVQVPRLIGVFLLLMGLGEHARIAISTK